MADLTVAGLPDEKAAPLPEFTGGSSGRSDDDMDDLQFGNVEVIPVMDDTQPMRTSLAAAKQKFEAPTCPNPELASAQQLCCVKSTADAHAVIAHAKIQELQAMVAVLPQELEAYMDMHYSKARQRISKPNRPFLLSLVAKGALQVKGVQPNTLYGVASGAKAPADAEVQKIVAWLDSLPRKAKDESEDKKQWRQLAADKLILHCIATMQEFDGASAPAVKAALAAQLGAASPDNHSHRRQYAKLADSIIQDLMQNGTLRDFNPFQPQTDEPPKKKPKPKSLSQLTRLCIVRSVTLNQLQQAHEFLDLPPPPKGLALQRAVAAAPAAAQASANSAGFNAMAGTADVNAQKPSGEDSTARQPAVASPATADVKPGVEEASSGVTAVKAEEKGQSANSKQSEHAAAPQLPPAVSAVEDENGADAKETAGHEAANAAIEAAAAAEAPADHNMTAEAEPVLEAFADTALPAYAMQMDGPNDIFSAQPDNPAGPDPAASDATAHHVGASAADHPISAVVLAHSLPDAQAAASAPAKMPAADPAESAGKVRQQAVNSDAGSGSLPAADAGRSSEDGSRLAGKRMSHESDPEPAQSKRQKTSAGPEAVEQGGLVLDVLEDKKPVSFPNVTQRDSQPSAALSNSKAPVSGPVSSRPGFASDDAQVRAPPLNTTWLQRYQAAHPQRPHLHPQHRSSTSWHPLHNNASMPADQGIPNSPQGRFGNQHGQGPSGCPLQGRFASPPALALLDSATGSWVPTKHHMNPFVMAQMQQPMTPHMPPLPHHQHHHHHDRFSHFIQPHAADDAHAHASVFARQQGPLHNQGYPNQGHWQQPHAFQQPQQGHLQPPDSVHTGQAWQTGHQVQATPQQQWQRSEQPQLPQHGMHQQQQQHYQNTRQPQGQPQGRAQANGQAQLPPLRDVPMTQGQATEPSVGVRTGQRAQLQAAAGFRAGPRAANAATKSLLHQELTEFAALATPSQEERAAVRQALDAVAQVARLLWPHSRTLLFGSQATNLALPGSDLDIVILGVAQDLTAAASGFTKIQRGLLGELLQDLLKGLKAADMLKGKAQVIDAKVPIIKCTLKFGPGLAADISLGAVNGAAAVQYVRSMATAAPPLRTLVLFIKALLKETMLNEVFSGGLSSYSIVNMVMAFLQSVGYPSPTLPTPDPSAATEAASSSQATAVASHNQDMPQAWSYPVGQPEEDVGELLLGFLHHFGGHFDYLSEAVSVREGGFIRKLAEWKQPGKSFLLSVEDAQQPGKDIGSGSFKIQLVQQLFAAAAATLQQCLAKRAQHAGFADEMQREAAAWAVIQADGASSSNGAVSHPSTGFSMLNELIVVEMAVGRTNAAAKMRRQQAKQFVSPQSRTTPVLACHAVLRTHMRAMPAVPAPNKPSFPVGKARKKAPVVQVQQASSKERKKANQGREKERWSRQKPERPAQTPGGAAKGQSGQHSGAKKTNGKTRGKHAASNAAKRAANPHAAAQRAASQGKRQRKQQNTAGNGNVHHMQQGGVKKNRKNRNKM